MANYTAEDIQKIRIFEGLTGEQRLKLFETSKQHRLEKNKVVINEGDPIGGVFGILKGSVRVTKTVDGETKEFAKLHAGEVFGEMSLVEELPRFANVTTLEPTVLLEFRREDFLHLFERDSKIAHQVYLNLAKALSAKLRFFGENVKEITLDWI